MPPRTHPWLKRFMWASMLVLGLQLCLPLSLQASVVSTQQIDVISLGIKDPSGKPGVHVDFDLPPVVLVLLFVPKRTDMPAEAREDRWDVPIPALLPVAGYHPAAP